MITRLIDEPDFLLLFQLLVHIVQSKCVDYHVIVTQYYKSTTTNIVSVFFRQCYSRIWNRFCIRRKMWRSPKFGRAFRCRQQKLKQVHTHTHWTFAVFDVRIWRFDDNIYAQRLEDACACPPAELAPTYTFRVLPLTNLEDHRLCETARYKMATNKGLACRWRHYMDNLEHVKLGSTAAKMRYTVHFMHARFDFRM